MKHVIYEAIVSAARVSVGSTVSSPSRVSGGAPTENKFDAF